jgi:small subunit ribosomal protein S17
VPAAAPVAKAAVKRVVRRRATVPAKPTAAVVAARPGGAPATHRRTKVGVVVSAKQARTVVVEVERMRQHPLYKKSIRIRKKFAAHDADGDVKAGDLVRIQESRPFSATKRWRVLEVLSRAGEAGAAAPRVADIEKALEEAEGVTEIFAAPVRPETPEREAEPQEAQ